jgi:hypothetical protein
MSHGASAAPLPTRRYAHASGKDVCIGALQAEEGSFETESQETAGFAEVIIGGCRQQMHAGGVAANQRQYFALEAVPVGAVAQLDARDQVRFAGQQFIDRQGGKSRVGGGVGTDGVGVAAMAVRRSDGRSSIPFFGRQLCLSRQNGAYSAGLSPSAPGLSL